MNWRYPLFVRDPEFLSRERKSQTWKILIVVLLALAVLGSLSGGNSGTPEESPNTGDSVSNTAWVPKGFDLWNNEIAYKWVEDPICNTYSVCAAIQVNSNQECPNNLYAELILQDKNYVQYDYTNDSQGSLAKGSTAELTFNFAPDERFAHFDLSKISCR